MCVRTFSSVQSSTAFQRFPRLTAQLFADTRNGKTRNSTEDPRKFYVSCTVRISLTLYFSLVSIMFTQNNTDAHTNTCIHPICTYVPHNLRTSPTHCTLTRHKTHATLTSSKATGLPQPSTQANTEPQTTATQASLGSGSNPTTKPTCSQRNVTHAVGPAQLDTLHHRQLGRCLQHRGGEPERAKGADGMQLFALDCITYIVDVETN